MSGSACTTAKTPWRRTESPEPRKTWTSSSSSPRTTRRKYFNFEIFSPNYNYEYYYDNPENQTDGETTINDAVLFNRRQFESSPVLVATPPTPAATPTVATSAKPKKKKKKKKPGARGPNRRKGLPALQQAGPGFRQRSPLNPPLKVAFAQIRLPIHRPGLKRRRKNNNDQQVKNGTVVNANQTNPAVPGPGKKKKGKKNNNQRNRNRNRNRKNGKNKKRGTKKPPTPPPVNNSQLEYERPPFMVSRYPTNNSPNPPFTPGPTTNGTQDDYYYEYYQDPPQGGGNGGDINGDRFGPSPNNGGNGNNNDRTPFGNNNDRPPFGNNNDRPPFGNNNGNGPPPPGMPSMPWGGTPSMGGPGGMSSLMGNRMPTTMSMTRTGSGVESESLNSCQTQNFNDASYCCALEHPTLFDSNDMDECLNDLNPDEEPPAIDEYSVNKGLIGKGVIDFQSASMKNLSDAICLTHCTMISLQFLSEDPNSLQYDEVRAYMDSNLNDNNETAWRPLLNEVSKTCQKAVKAMNQVQDRIETSDYTCFTKPYLYVQCILHYILFKCPTPSDRASSDFCKTSISSLGQECNPFDDN
ncbi:probable cyclin-dependent serine/threonine-protein kinase DDB_G0292550 [Neocloeon triangulifer]|uniref:probable cyclin-dependent serine/threonine-protein kinase DDB_G0292550 n=1 Tax=Neocloeon triangulifer TaxID=2078957 RepID=UPI00286ECB8F|nr:probable cyclin-dependent serine/threonine-protein kinase DDB_G0292550 [Neocloeon triangulifer]